MENLKYFHDEIHHNLKASSIIVPLLVQKIKPKSVVDVGCGIGTFLNVFKKEGVRDIVGLDGEWVNTELLKKYIDIESLKIVDLEKVLILGRRFDLAVSLEVAEHIKESSVDVFVENLVNLSDVIVFSAAFPGQGGQNHVNEQWPSYWAEKFGKHGYGFYDVLRPIFWDNKDIDIWYRQNMFLVLKESKKYIVKAFVDNNSKKLLNFVHPEIFESHLQNSDRLQKLRIEMDKVLKGKADFKTYIKLILKYLLRKINLYRK